MILRDGGRLAVGTLTVVPVPPPGRVDAGVARTAMLLAPVAVLPIGAAVVSIGLIGHQLSLPPLVTALLALGALALGSRNFHLDGLSDTVDGLAASYDRARSLQVMKSGTAGPAGVVALIIVIGIQAAALAALVTTPGGAVLAGVAVLVSRTALALCCARGVPSARPDGLGGVYAGAVPRTGAALLWLLAAAALTATAAVTGLGWWRGLLAMIVALVVVLLLIRRVRRRLGGVTGDVFGAAVELSLTALLVALA